MKISKILKNITSFFNFSNSFWFYILNFLLVLIFLCLIWISWITYTRLLVFLIILMYIYFYKMVMYLILVRKLKFFLIKNKKSLNYLWIIHKWSNPLLRLILLLEERFIYPCLKKERSKFVKILIFLVFIVFINPIKIFFTKYFRVYDKWKHYSYRNITIQRIVGLILSVVFIAQIINFIIFHSPFGMIILLYIAILILNLINEWVQPFINPQVLKFWHLENLSIRELLYRRIDISLVGILLEYNNINLRDKYNIEVNFFIVSKFKISFTWFMIDNYSNLDKKPSYLLLKLIALEYYEIIDKVQDSIFLIHYYKELSGDALILQNKYDPNSKYISLPKFLKDSIDLEQVNWIQIKAIYDFNFLVYKFLLFLVWDIEIYLGRSIKDVTDQFIYKNITIDGAFDIISFQHYFLGIEAVSYYRLIKEKGSLNFNLLEIFNKLKIYNFCRNMLIKPKYIDNNMLFKENFKRKYLELLDDNFIDNVLRVCQDELGSCPLEIYIEHINTIYNEYKEIPIDKKMDYYTTKLNMVEIEYKKLKKLLLNEK